ncbi:MAG: hypothetical protein JJU37_13990 [Balneolaceae bacterium]|nr:hypothetical protein [Balneolaceae bacterium]
MIVQKTSLKIYSGFLIIVLIASACGDSTSANNEEQAVNEIESRWAAIVEMATSPNPLVDSDNESPWVLFFNKDWMPINSPPTKMN